jgi:hypothetical protein
MITTAQLLEGQKTIPDKGIMFKVKLVNLTRYALREMMVAGRDYTGLMSLHNRQCLRLIDLVRAWNEATEIVEQQGQQIRDQLLGEMI